MKRFLIVLMALGLTAGSEAAVGAERGFQRTERTVGGSYAPYCNAGRGSLACLTVETNPSEDSFTAEVRDAHGQPVYVEVVSEGTGIVGTFCGETSQPVSFVAGSNLEFVIEPTPYFWSHWGVEWVGPLDCPYRLATTGTIRVTLSGWTASGQPAAGASAPSESPAPQPTPSQEMPTVERSVDLDLRRHLRAAGSVVAADSSCSSDVPVVIQRRAGEVWRDVASTTTDAGGAFALRVSDRSGRYRAIASTARTRDTTCLAAKSATARHRH